MRQSEKGSTIIELLIATLVVGSVVTGIAVAMTYNIRRNAEVRYREAATSMSQQALEAFRRERERTNWEAFYAGLANGETYCVNEPLAADLTNLTSRTGGCGINTYEYSKTDYQREVTISKPDADTITFTSTVFWHANTEDEVSVSTVHTMKKRLH